MELHTLLQNFNPSKFVVYNCLLAFSILFALRLDHTIKISYWTVFLPLWIWKALAITGALVGTMVWFHDTIQRLSDTSYVNFKAMIISLSLQLLLLMFEMLSVDKLETGRHIWVLAFIPLIFVSLLSVTVCVWAMRHDREYELELFCSVNVVQFILIAIRLDRFIVWSWASVFTPLWLVLFFCMFDVIYALFFSLFRSPDSQHQDLHRRTYIHIEIARALVIFPFLLFLFLLCHKLDGETSIFGSLVSNPMAHYFRLDYFTVCLPLYLSLFMLVCLSFNSKGANIWWFGIRKDFCSFLLTTCPCFREYGNISYHKQSASHSNSVDTNLNMENNINSNAPPTITVSPNTIPNATADSILNQKNNCITNGGSLSASQMTIESPD